MVHPSRCGRERSGEEREVERGGWEMEGGRKEKRKDRAGEEMEREGEREEGGIKAERRGRGREQRT